MKSFYKMKKKKNRKFTYYSEIKYKKLTFVKLTHPNIKISKNFLIYISNNI
jgi:hypothetical protein